MRIALGAALLAMAVLPGCQERPLTFHVVPAYPRGLLALVAPDHRPVLEQIPFERTRSNG